MNSERHDAAPSRRTLGRARTRSGRCALLILALALLAPASAHATGNTITGLHLDGSATAGVAFPFTVEASVENPLGGYLTVAVESAGSECPAQPTGFYKNGIEPGGFPVTENAPPLARGSYVLCAWLSNPENAESVYDSRSLAFTVSDGGTIALSFSPTPVDGLWLTITATGSSAAAGHVIATYKPSAPGAGCAGMPQADTGLPVGFARGVGGGYGGVAAGSYSIAARDATLALGSYLFCTWLIDEGERLLTASSQVVSVGPFRGSISLPAPFTITSAAHAKVPVSFVLNAPRRLWVTILLGGSTCAPSFHERLGSSAFPYPGFEQIGRAERVLPGTEELVRELQPAGTFDVDVRGNVTNLFTGQLIPGSYRVCAWLANDDVGAQTDFGPVATTVTVAGGSSAGAGGGAAVPYVQGYEYRFDAAHTLRLKVWLTGKATLVITLYRGAGRHKRRLATITTAAHRGLNKITLRRFHGRRLKRGRYTISLYTRVGHRRSPARSFVFTL